jgi:hypothetical protein
MGENPHRFVTIMGDLQLSKVDDMFVLSMHELRELISL